MTFEALWKALESKNPSLSNGSAKVTITAEQFKRALQQSYEAGSAQSAKLSKTFDKIFGGLGL